MSNPSLVKSLPEESISEGEDWWVISSIEVLEAVSIAAGSWGRSSIDTSDDGSTKHDIRGVSVIEGSGKSSNISNDSTTDDEYWFVSGNTVVLQVNQNVLNVSNIFIDFISAMDQHDKRDIVGREIFVEGITEELLNFVVNNSDTSTEWLVDLSQDWVGWLQDTSGDLDGSGDAGAHDSFDGLGIWRSHGDSIAVSVDTGWVNGVRIDTLKIFVVLKIGLSLSDL